MSCRVRDVITCEAASSKLRASRKIPYGVAPALSGIMRRTVAEPAFGVSVGDYVAKTKFER